MPTAISLNHLQRYLDPLALRISGPDDIRICLASDYIESLTTTSDFGRLDFWFARWSRPVPDGVNRPATELLLAATSLSPGKVPLLRGRVFLKSHDAHGLIASLTREQILEVVSHTPV
jgi:hypothetical protein